MDPLYVLEKRVEYLSKVLPKETKENLKEDNVIDSIISADTLISSAIRGHEKMNEVVKRSGEVEKFLDPSFVVENQQINMKEIYINTMVNELAQSFELLDKIKQLQPTLGAEYFGGIPDVTEKLKVMLQSAKEQKERNEITEETLITSIQRYSELQEEIHRKLKEMSDELDRFEEEQERRKKADDQ